MEVEASIPVPVLDSTAGGHHVGGNIAWYLENGLLYLSLAWAAIEYRRNREIIWHQTLHRGGMSHSTLGAGLWEYKSMKQISATVAVTHLHNKRSPIDRCCRTILNYQCPEYWLHQARQKELQMMKVWNTCQYMLKTLQVDDLLSSCISRNLSVGHRCCYGSA